MLEEAQATSGSLNKLLTGLCPFFYIFCRVYTDRPYKIYLYLFTVSTKNKQTMKKNIYIYPKNKKAIAFLKNQGYTLTPGVREVFIPEYWDDNIGEIKLLDVLYVGGFMKGVNAFHKLLKDNGLLYRDQH